MNSVELIGRLTRDPELKMSRSDQPVCVLRIAVDRMGEGDQAGYIDVAVFGKSGEACARELTKGWLVGVAGRLRYREWEPNEGGKRSALSVIGSVDFLAAPRRAEHEETRAAA